MKIWQEKVKVFNDERDWSKLWSIKDMMLNLVEETGEAWNIIKWLRDNELEAAVAKNKDKFEDFIGDQLYILFKLAYLTGVDSDEALRKTMEEYEQRFPINETKGRHANIHSGGIDKKYPNQYPNQKQRENLTKGEPD